MNSFLKIFLASLLALIVFTVAAFFMLIGMAGSLASSDKPTVGGKAVLVVNLEDVYQEIAEENPIAELSAGEESQKPALYDLLRMIRHAKSGFGSERDLSPLRQQCQWLCYRRIDPGSAGRFQIRQQICDRLW